MVLDSSQVIRIYTTRLVNSLVPEEFGVEYKQSLVTELLSAFNRVDGAKTNSDLNSIIQQYKRVFISNGKQNEWVQFNDVIRSLTQMKTTGQIRSYLVFLGSLKGDAEPPKSSGLKSSGLRSSGLGFGNVSSPRVSSAGSFMNPRSAHMSLDSSPYKRDLHFSGGLAMEEIIKPYYDTLDESFILQYLSYALMGINSKILTFVDDGNDISVDIPPSINNSYSQLLGKIVEPALIYIKLKKTVSEANGLTPIKTSFVAFLSHELNNYTSFINQLTTKQTHSLFQVYNELYPIILRLRLFYHLTNQLHLSGYDFLQATYQLTKFGDSTIRDLSERIFHKISSEYYEILENWILRGELIDVNQEFFIEFNDQADNIQDIIVYLPNKVPNFFITINKNISFKIFQIGKILIFLDKYCKELQYINNYTVKYSNFVFEANSGLQTMNINIINELINNQYKELVNYLTFVVHGKYEMIKHLQNYRKFLLMSTEDFVDALMLKGYELFNLPSNQLTSNQLSKVLVESINYSSVKNYDLDIKNRLDARILNLSHGNIGWQVVTMEYRVDDLPINSIINYKESVIEYLKMFNFLWKMKQASYVLNLKHVESMNLKRNDLQQFNKQFIRIRREDSLSYRNLKVKYLIKAFKSVNLMRNNLVKFTNNLIDYLNFLTTSNYTDCIKLFYKNRNQKKFTISNDFKQLLSEDKYHLPSVEVIENNLNELNFEELIDANASYVKKFNFKILDNRVTGKSGESYISQIYKMFDLIYQFIGSNEEFHAKLIEYVSLLHVDKNSDLEEIDGDFNFTEMRLKEIVNKISFGIYKEFNLNLEVLIKDFKSDVDLRDLGKMW